MSTPSIAAAPRGLKPIIVLALAAALTILPAAGLLAADATETVEPAATTEPSLSPAQAACDSADDLRLIVGFLRDTDVEEDGWVPLLVGVIAGLSEARTLAGLVDEAYRPLVDDLIVSLQGIRTTVDELGGLETTGARIAAIGETITDIGNAMDALSTQLRTPCPVD
jgi:hypothetical protein